MLGTDELTWLDLWVVATYAPQTSQIARAILGESGLWTLTDHLLAVVVDVLNDANWQRGGAKGTRPKRISRPGQDDKSGSTIGADPIPISEWDDWWNSDQPAEETDSAGNPGWTGIFHPAPVSQGPAGGDSQRGFLS